MTGEVCLNFITDAARISSETGDEATETRSTLRISRKVMTEASLVRGFGCLR